MIAKVYKAAKVPEKPVIYFDKAIAVQPNYTPALRGKAEYLYFARKWEDATKAYKELVSKGAEVIIEDEMQLPTVSTSPKTAKAVANWWKKFWQKMAAKTTSAASKPIAITKMAIIRAA